MPTVFILLIDLALGAIGYTVYRKLWHTRAVEWYAVHKVCKTFTHQEIIDQITAYDNATTAADKFHATSTFSRALDGTWSVTLCRSDGLPKFAEMLLVYAFRLTTFRKVGPGAMSDERDTEVYGYEVIAYRRAEQLAARVLNKRRYR